MSTLNRRSFLRQGLGAGLALTTPAAALPPSPGLRRKVKGVIWLWMDGGMCQSHTWDPKPGAQSGCQVKAMDTAVPGIPTSQLLPLCAPQMGHLTILPTLAHPVG